METPPAIISPAAARIDLERMVNVLIAVENTPWATFGGALGWTTDAWKEETRLPFKLTSYPPQAKIVAQQRLAKIAALFQRFDVPVTVESLAGAWKHGPTGSMSRIKRGRISDYMQRARNLYDDPTFAKSP